MNKIKVGHYEPYNTGSFNRAIHGEIIDGMDWNELVRFASSGRVDVMGVYTDEMGSHTFYVHDTPWRAQPPYECYTLRVTRDNVTDVPIQVAIAGSGVIYKPVTS